MYSFTFRIASSTLHFPNQVLQITQSLRSIPAKIYLFKFNNRNTRKICEICSKLTINKLE